MQLPGNTSLSFLFEFARQLNPNISSEEVERVAAIAAMNIQQQQQQDVSSTPTAPAVQQHVQQQRNDVSSTPPPLLPPTLQRPAATPAAAAAVTAVHPHISAGTPMKLSLEIGHNCLSSGCGDSSCSLCQHNQSRRCKADLKQKYVTRDYIRSNCGAGLLVRLIDDNGQHYTQPLPGWKLQVCVLDAKRYKELNPTNIQLGFDSLAPCILDKPLLRWENSSETAVVTLPVESGQVHLPELQCFSITGEHRAGKACDYRLACWIEHQPILPRVSEPFTVVCLRSRAAVKSEVPLSDEPVGRLEGIGEQAVSTLKTLGQQLGLDSGLPAELGVVEKVGQFCDLIKVVQSNSQLERQLLPLFKKADWKKATQHAACTVFPDFRPRVWWYPRHDSECGRIGLLFRCENAIVQIQRPFAWVQQSQAAPGALGTIRAAVADEIQVFAHPGQQEQQVIQLAAQDWDSPQHGNWSIYWLDPVDPLAHQSLNPSSPIAQTLGLSANPEHLPYGILAAAGITSPAASAGVHSTSGAVLAAAVAAATAAAAAADNNNSAAGAASGGGPVPSRWLATPQQEAQTQQQLADLHLAQQLASLQQQQQPSPFYTSQPSADASRATITTGAVLPPPPPLQQPAWGSNGASAVSEAMAALSPLPALQQSQPLPWGSTTRIAMSEAMVVAQWLSGPTGAAPASSADPLAAAATLATLAAAAAGSRAAASSDAAAAAASSSQCCGSSSHLSPVSLSGAAVIEHRQPAVSMFSPPAGLMEQMPASLRGEEMLTDMALKGQKSDPLSVSMAWIPDHLADDFPGSLIPGVMQVRSVTSNGSRDQISAAAGAAASAAAAAGAGLGSKRSNTAGPQHGLQESYSLPSDILNSVVWKAVMAPDVAATESHVLRDIMALADSFRNRAQQGQQQQQHDQDHDGDVNMASAGIGDEPSLSELQRTVLANLTAVVAQSNAGQMPPSLLKSDSLLGSEQERLLQECNQALLLKQLADQLQQKQQQHVQQQKQQQHRFPGWHR